MKIHKKIKIKWILVVTLILLIALPLTANAQSVTSQMSSVFGEVLQGFAQFLAITLKVLQRILWPIFLAIGGLLNNDILFGYGMEQRLLEVWVQIRNFVNIIFVVVLLGVALFNVLAVKPDSEFALKSFLPKFAIALIAVNFSYIGMKIILDVSNVMTYAVFALPSSISQEVATPRFIECKEDNNVKKCTVKTDEESQKTITKVCTAYYGTSKEWKEMEIEINKLSQDQQDSIRSGLLCKLDSDKYSLSDSGFQFFQRFNSRNVALIMAIQFMNVTKVDEVSTGIVKGSTATTKDGKLDVSGLAFQLLFAVILYIVYGAAYLAIFVVLLTRLVALWLFIALSPLIVLKFVLPQSVMPESGGDLGQKFFKNAFAPVLMGVPLTIGYIILEAFKGLSYKSNGGLETALDMVKVDNAAISDLQSMIIAFAAVAVVWVGVFAAARGTFAELATDFIKQKVSGIGKKALQGLKLIPMIPAGQGGKGLSLYQAGAQINKPWEKIMKKYGPGSLASGKIGVNKIRKIGRSTTSTTEEAKKAITGGLGTPRGQKAVYSLLETWRKRSGRQGTFAKEAIRKMGTDYKKLKSGRASAGEVKRIKRIPYLQPAVAAGVAVSTRRLTMAGGTKPGTELASESAANQDISTINQADSLGIVSSGLIQKRNEHRDAFKLKTDKDRKARRDSVQQDISSNHGDEMKNLRKAVGVSTELGAVKSSVGGLDSNAKGDAVKKLEQDLEKASAALKKRNVDDIGRKQILGNILKNKFGDDTKKFVDVNKEIGDLVTI